MVTRMIIGAVIGGLIGLGGNYLCALTGAACPLMDNKAIAVVLCALIGGLIGAAIYKRPGATREIRLKYKGVSIDIVGADSKWFYACNTRKKVNWENPSLPKISEGWFNTKEEAREHAESEIDLIIDK
ncbi:MAG: hypothetical protein WBD04_07870 [Candidatus Omnitrophota bacterium]